MKSEKNNSRNQKVRRGIVTISLIALAGFGQVSCETTEEGLVTGALLGAALGGIAGHSNEHSGRRYRGSGYGYSDRGYYSSRPRRAYRNRYDYGNYSPRRGRTYYRDDYCY